MARKKTPKKKAVPYSAKVFTDCTNSVPITQQSTQNVKTDGENIPSPGK